ncbi:unnamed protein product, partial [Timema podura]|nr:unnamed protein product [Timema podura]
MVTRCKVSGSNLTWSPAKGGRGSNLGQLNESLLLVHKNLETKLNESYANSVLSSVCEHGFENYALQRLHGSTTLMEAAPWSDLVPTTLDGMWTDKLKELCRFYLSEFGATRLYDSWWGAENYPRHDMIANLC